MPRSVVFHPAARAEFRAAVAEYEAQRAGLGTAMALEVRELVDLARVFPQMGSPYSVPGVRRLFPRTFPYAVAYLVIEEALFIVAVAHGHREPDYWHERLAPPTGPV